MKHKGHCAGRQHKQRGGGSECHNAAHIMQTTLCTMQPNRTEYFLLAAMLPQTGALYLTTRRSIPSVHKLVAPRCYICLRWHYYMQYKDFCKHMTPNNVKQICAGHTGLALFSVHLCKTHRPLKSQNLRCSSTTFNIWTICVVFQNSFPTQPDLMAPVAFEFKCLESQNWSFDFSAWCYMTSHFK